jgi:hypothetical protein
MRWTFAAMTWGYAWGVLCHSALSAVAAHADPAAGWGALPPGGSGRTRSPGRGGDTGRFPAPRPAAAGGVVLAGGEARRYGTATWRRQRRTPMFARQSRTTRARR